MGVERRGGQRGVVGGNLSIFNGVRKGVSGWASGVES